MNLSVSNPTFSGKREVLYGLKNAANEARRAEFHRAFSFGPRPIDRSSRRDACLEAMHAYMDMAVYDDSFEKVIKELPKEEEGNVLRNLLMPEKVQWGEINPLRIFSNSLIGNCKTQEKNIHPDAINNFLKFLQ